MMKSSHIIFFCLLAPIVYLFYRDASFSSSSSIFLPGRRFMREMGTSMPKQMEAYYSTKVNDEDITRPMNKRSSTATVLSTGGDNLDEIIYHIDYHGVTTHPTPTPKHPQP